ncbi:unnamed protein product [Rodentolepis nana]|uniref:Zinc finger protein n=1 Tax=Rodentolepis nana TaxID=102285 RepID=A0A0R3TBC9_RODNA|nr:unnamed protein product [Rodentolepis nana]
MESHAKEHNACKEEASDPQVLDLSIKVEEVRLECSRCKMTFSCSRLLREHLFSVHKLPEPHRCDECGAYFASKWSLNGHIRNLHPKQPTTRCDQSAEMNPDKPSLQSHKRGSDDKMKKYQCPSCTKSFANKSNLTAHVDQIHLQKKHKCGICGRHYTSKAYLKKHIKEVHSDRKIFHCPQCEKFFSSRRTRNKHYLAAHEKSNRIPVLFVLGDLPQKLIAITICVLYIRPQTRPNMPEYKVLNQQILLIYFNFFSCKTILEKITVSMADSFLNFGLVVKTTRVCLDCHKLANTDHFRVYSESRH